MVLFQKPPDPLREALRKVDPDRMTPLDALTVLSEIKSRMDSENS
jgi:hypothetical protein